MSFDGYLRTAGCMARPQRALVAALRGRARTRPGASGTRQTQRDVVNATLAGCGDVEDLLPNRIHDRLHPGVQLQLLQDVADVVLHGVFADEQLGADLAVVHTAGDQLEHVEFTLGQARRGDLPAVIRLLDH